ncbi:MULTISPECIES: hypothetical protein [unclassified Variovorax]|jgi:hypothetical protein|nr:MULTISPECIES: hypothetical protein [unclassified Variovorax]MCT8177435.1 hypothetical protein [Variovorax sp. CY25R-8]
MHRHRSVRWPRTRSLGQLLQSPAHCVLRVLLVTQAHWQLPEHRSRRRRA